MAKLIKELSVFFPAYNEEKNIKRSESLVKGFVLIPLLIVVILLAIGLLFYSSFLRQPSRLNLSPLPGEEEKIPTFREKPKYSLVYTKAGTLSMYDFKNGVEVDFKLNPVTQYIWSTDGKLAVLAQGKYAGELESKLIPEAYATTAGFLYSLHYVDIANKTTAEVLSEVFGEVNWSKDSTGFYISERYLKGKPMLIDEQSGLSPDRIDYFYVAMNGRKTPVSKDEFESKRYVENDNYSPDGKYYFEYDYPIPYVVSVENGKKYSLNLEDFYLNVVRPKWSPDGQRIAYLYETGGSSLYYRQIAYLDEVLKGYKYKNIVAMGSESKFFYWIDNNRLLETSFKYDPPKGYYKGDIFITNIKDEKSEKIVSNIYSREVSKFIISPDRRFFTFMEGKTYEDLKIVVMDISGGEIIRLNGRDPSWIPYKND